MNFCRHCKRPMDLDEDGWLVHFDKKNRGRFDERVWFVCPDHTFEQLRLF